MDSSEQYAQRTEDSAQSRRSTEASNVPPENTPRSERVQETPERDVRSRSKNFKELRQLGAVDFYGTTDPAEAETWLKRTERVFGMMRCTVDEQYDFAVSLLQGDAYDWWETVPGSTVRPSILTYADFLREFRDRYMPEVYQDEKQREFLNLKQRTMTVAEYEVKFQQLSHYAPMMVATDRDRCRRFEEGLNYEIRDRLTPGDLRSYSDLRAAAIRAERLQKKMEKYLASKKSKRSETRPGGGNSSRSGKRSGYNAPTQSQGRGDSTRYRGGQSQAAGQSGSRGPGTTAQNVPVCEHCGKRHPGECWAVTGACYSCGEQGHFRRECPR